MPIEFNCKGSRELQMAQSTHLSSNKTWLCCRTGMQTRALTQARPSKGRHRVAKIPSNCIRRCSRLNGQILGRHCGCQQDGHQVSLRDLCHQYHGLCDHWFLADRSDQARRLESCLEIPGASRIHWRVQYVFNLRVGDSFHDSNRRFLTRRPLRSQQSHSRACRCVGRLCSCGDPVMRTQKQLVFYESILDVLREPGCPFCRFLKEYQAARLQNRPEKDTHRLCNFHTWGLAAVQNALTAAQVFIKLVDSPVPTSNEVTTCDICNEIVA